MATTISNTVQTKNEGGLSLCLASTLMSCLACDVFTVVITTIKMHNLVPRLSHVQTKIESHTCISDEKLGNGLGMRLMSNDCMLFLSSHSIILCSLVPRLCRSQTGTVTWYINQTGTGSITQ